MKTFKLSALFLIGTLGFAGCNQLPQNDSVYNNPQEIYEDIQGDPGYGEQSRWARENLDLEAVGALLERADDAEEFEYLLNDPNEGINNLDLNGDGYADYISVREFGEGDQRGFSLFDAFGPELIQEIATIFFDRDNGYDYPGARVLMRGNEQIYGDNYYYETNWLDRAIPIVSYLFTERGGDDDYYVSPYYYENYPSYYEPYTIVETPVYRERIAQYYATPVFVQTTQPTVTNIRIVSPNAGRSVDKIYSRLAKPTREQIDFVRSNPKPPKPERVRNEKFQNAPGKPDKADKQFDRNERRAKFEQTRREKPNKQERVAVQQPMREQREQQKFERQQQKFERQQQQQQQRFERQNQPQRVERPQPQQQRVERQQQPRFERPQQQQQPRLERPQQMKQPKQENRPQNGGGNPNRGGGGGGGNGGGNKGGGGGGKGKGKG